jgi:hypothetical protein
MTVNFGRIFGAVIKVGLVFGFAAGVFWVVTHRQVVLDWWQLQSYKPAAEIVALADSTTMVGRGRDLFYVSDPKVQDSKEFNLNCKDKSEEGMVLGCFVTNTKRIYIYNVTDKRLPRTKEVTAAHEMLHAAYDRLDSTVRERVDRLVQADADKLKGDKTLNDLIKWYIKEEPGELLNELHSILGTQYGNLSAELEAYYRQYFSDRSKVVKYSQDHESVFLASKAKIAEYHAQLKQLKQQISNLEVSLKQKRAELDSESARLDALRRSDPNAYNQAVPGFNAKVLSFNALAKEYNALIAKHNSIVELLEKEAAAQEGLYKSLDSHYQPR